jgi:hypothetical protein
MINTKLITLQGIQTQPNDAFCQDNSHYAEIQFILKHSSLQLRWLELRQQIFE